MFKRIKLRINDMKTISLLISGADKEANTLGEDEPGAEHYVLSALNLPDGSAKRVFKRVGIDSNDFKIAIRKQYSNALSSVGVSETVFEGGPEPIESTKLFLNSKPSGQALMKLLYALKKNDKHRPLLGAHVLSVVSSMEFGVAVRAFSTMGIESSQLAAAVKNELDKKM